MNSRERKRLLAMAEDCFRTGHHGQARLILENLAAAGQASSKVHELLGYISGNEGDLPSAHRHLQRACELPGRSAEAMYYLGVSWLKQGQPRAAIGCFSQALALGGPFFEALHELGTAYTRTGELHLALEQYLKALRLNPHSFDLLFNIGKVHDELRALDKALDFYDRAIAVDPQVADAWAHKGAVLYDVKRYVDALACWERAFSLDPQVDFLYGFMVHARLRLGDWSRLGPDRRAVLEQVGTGAKAAGPFEILAISFSDEINLQVSQRWVGVNYPGTTSAFPRNPRTGDRIRVGYFSADFGNHPVSQLTAELYEIHDREGFEVIGFALERPAAGEPTWARLERGFDRLIDVRGKSDAEVAALSRSLGIDIAVDLGGHTQRSRTGIFHQRAAPVQVNFLGYPGTMGAEFIDYIVADEVVIPPASRGFFTEKVVWLPECFQPTDTKTLPATTVPDRAAFGLPAQGFVFCCFNNTYKITPDAFDVWMKILAAVPGSVLWLLADVAQVESNLRREAGQRGIDGDRLIFAGRLPFVDHLARYSRADLFLDTLPFNGGATVNGALWAGLPVLTMPGGSVVGRMASSLLQTLDVPELIARDTGDYAERAVSLATDEAALRAVTAKLALNRVDKPLFDAPRYTRHLESAYREMHRRATLGEPPGHLIVPPLPA